MKSDENRFFCNKEAWLKSSKYEVSLASSRKTAKVNAKQFECEIEKFKIAYLRFFFLLNDDSDPKFDFSFELLTPKILSFFDYFSRFPVKKTHKMQNDNQEWVWRRDQIRDQRLKFTGMPRESIPVTQPE